MNDDFEKWRHHVEKNDHSYIMEVVFVIWVVALVVTALVGLF